MDNAYMYLSVGLAVFMAVVLLFGFLLGLIRGWKKSVLRFSIFVGISIIVLLCMPAILTLSTENIVINGQTLQQYVASLIEQGMPELANVMVGSVDLVTAMAVAACGSIVFLVLFIVIKILTWIVYSICCIFIRKKNTKKRRFIGGLIGIVQALFVCFIYMLPVAGYTNIANQVTTAFATAFEQTLSENEDPTESSNNQQILQNLKDIAKTTSAYKKSMPGVIYGVGGLDLKTFNYLSVATVDGQKVKFSTEVNNMIALVDTIATEFDLAKLLDVQDVEGLKAYLNKVEEGKTETNAERLITLLSNGLFESDILKALMVDGVNNLAAETQKVLNALTPEQQVEIGLFSDVVIEKVKVSEIDWKKEQQTFSTVMSKSILAFIDIYNTLNKNGEAQIDFSKLPFETIGEAIDNLKNMQLFKNVFDPVLRRFLAVEKIINEPIEGADGQTENLITIAEKIYKETQFETTDSVTGEVTKTDGIDLRKVGNYRDDVVFKDLFTAIGKTYALIEKMNGQDGFNLGVGDISDILLSLNTLPEELKTQVDQTIKAVAGEVKIGDQTLNQLGLGEVNIIECAPVVGPLLDVATVVQGLNGETSKLDSASINKVVSSVEQVATNFENLEEENKAALNNFVNKTIAAVAGEGVVVSENLIGDIAKDSAIVEAVLTSKFSETQASVNEIEVVDALLDNGAITQILINTNVTQVFTTTKQESEIRALFENSNKTEDEINKYVSLFNFKTTVA